MSEGTGSYSDNLDYIKNKIDNNLEDYKNMASIAVEMLFSPFSVCESGPLPLPIQNACIFSKAAVTNISKVLKKIDAKKKNLSDLNKNAQVGGVRHPPKTRRNKYKKNNIPRKTKKYKNKRKYNKLKS